MNQRTLGRNVEAIAEGERLHDEVKRLKEWLDACEASRIGIVLPMPPFAEKLLKEIDRLETELAQAKAENARLKGAITRASDQLKRGEWSSNVSGTWAILNDALRPLLPSKETSAKPTS